MSERSFEQFDNTRVASQVEVDDVSLPMTSRDEFHRIEREDSRQKKNTSSLVGRCVDSSKQLNPRGIRPIVGRFKRIASQQAKLQQLEGKQNVFLRREEEENNHETDREHLVYGKDTSICPRMCTSRDGYTWVRR